MILNAMLYIRSCNSDEVKTTSEFGAQIILRNLIGEMLIKVSSEEGTMQINVKGLPQGIYLLEVPGQTVFKIIKI